MYWQPSSAQTAVVAVLGGAPQLAGLSHSQDAHMLLMRQTQQAKEAQAAEAAAALEAAAAEQGVRRLKAQLCQLDRRMASAQSEHSSASSQVCGAAFCLVLVPDKL